MSAGVHRIAIIGNYLPRQCGIATFTTHLCEAVSGQFPDLTCMAVPVNDTPDGYEYPAPVRFIIQQNELGSYRSAADYLNINRIDAINLQHEFGIFGGPAGRHILTLLADLRMPLLTTLHTVPHEPEPSQREVLEELIDLSDRLVVMSGKAEGLLRGLYGVAAEKIECIPHGIPDVPFTDPSFFKDQFGVEGKRVLLTFGLLGPSKGIEYVIEALPAVLERHPDVVYMVLGATHPNILKTEGETYRLSLQRLAGSLAVDQHVIFHNRFVSQEELVECIGAADIYITPYLNQDQIVSGTLAYTVGAGKAVISTPYWYADELLADGRGRLVPFRDTDAIADAILQLLDNEAERQAMRKRAYLSGRAMIWPAVAGRYVSAMERILEERARHPRPVFFVKPLAEGQRELPLLNLRHMQRLTDGTGILQHAVYIAPNYDEGYTTDDNARALIVMVLLEQLGKVEDAPVVDLAARYLAFLWHAFDEQTAKFRNFMSYERHWAEEAGSADSHGRALWALGTVLGGSEHEGLRGTAARLFDMALPAARKFTSPRAMAFTLLGLHEYSRRLAGDQAAQGARRTLARRLLRAHARSRGDDWEWFEDSLTYANASLPHALIASAGWLEDDEMLEVGLKTLDWLAAVQRGENNQFVPIGTAGFYRRGGPRARFDQQPLEAQAMVCACIEAYRLGGEKSWREEVRRAFEWYLGHNDLNVPLYDPSTGGCRDGLHPDSVNHNEGAESTLAFLHSLLELRLLEHFTAPSEERQVRDESRRPVGRDERAGALVSPHR
ncbi:MAG: glycosyltransferase family 4 protein [Gemmatimonadota bacterium]